MCLAGENRILEPNTRFHAREIGEKPAEQCHNLRFWLDNSHFQAKHVLRVLRIDISS